jgi:hypothetical protein
LKGGGDNISNRVYDGISDNVCDDLSECINDCVKVSSRLCL